MSKTFRQAIEANDPIFEKILLIMKIGRRQGESEIDKERGFLSVVNQVLDYYICRSGDLLKIPVLYFPICNENSQELCEEFVTLKLGLFASNDWREIVYSQLDIIKTQGLIIRSDERSPQVLKMAKNNHLYELCLWSILSDSENSLETTSLIYSQFLLNSFNQYKEAQKRYNRKTVNKYWYLSRSINGNYSADNECPLSLISGEEERFYNLLLNIGSEDGGKIENLVFFPCKSPDGDYSDFCKEIVQKAYFDDFVNAQSGLRNVFVFRFSRKPYRLRRILDINNLMKGKLGIHANDDCYDFISFSYDEAA